MFKGYMSTLLGDRLFRLTVSATFLCNLRCRHCNIWRIYTSKPELLERELKPSEIVETIISTKPFQVAITGGEPLIKPGVAEALVDLQDEKGEPYLTSINTNGYATDLIVKTIERMASIAESRVKDVAVSVSLDGPEDVHNRIRGVNDAYKRAVNTISKLKELEDEYKRLHVFIEYTIMEDNIGFFEEMVKSLEEITGRRFLSDEFVVNVVQASNYYNIGKKPVDYSKLLGEVKRVKKFLLRRMKRRRISKHSLFQKAFLSRLELWFQGKFHHKCFAAERSAFVDPYGDVYPCLPRYGVNKLGNVREYNYNVNLILKNDKSRLFREKIRPLCNCWTPCESYTTLALKPYLLLY